jgi:HECT-domain (ubiquitin-transferase).
MMIHDIIVKRKASLDQLRVGLEILGVLKAIKSSPMSMARYFIQNSKEVKTSDLISKLEFHEGTSDLNKNTFLHVVSNFNQESIKKFLVFVTGTANIFSLYPSQKIKVKFNESAEIFASTCEFLLILPSNINNSAILKDALNAVIDGSKWQQSFNTF